MNIAEIEMIFLRKINEAIEEVDNKNIKVTLLKKIASQSIDNALGRKQYNGLNSVSISAMFSGRGRAWGRVNIEDDIVWNMIKNTLHRDNDRKCIDLYDLFEQTGFAWMRYSSCKDSSMVFDLRFNGSKLEDKVKCYIPLALSCYIKNLDGVPHKLGLESGIFEANKKVKDPGDTEVSREDLLSFGIQSIEDLI